MVVKHVSDTPLVVDDVFEEFPYIAADRFPVAIEKIS